MDDLKWFGEGFDGFPRNMPEDCVEYTIYIIDTKLTDLEIRKKLRQMQVAASSLTKDLLKDFIWQRESFYLDLEREGGRSFLRGRTNYGDSVEDEWLIVYLLRELSKQFSQAWMRVVDTDGQFLLIEAANALPLWLNPEIADFRVWINDGKLIIIPVKNPGGRKGRMKVEPDTLTLDVAIKAIGDQETRLQHSAKIEAEAFYRLRKYPQQIAENFHHALVQVPRKLAYILHDKPAYISPAVEAFYLRDPIAMKPLQSKDDNLLVFPTKDLISASVKFTKVGFAQLKSQHFEAPPMWATALSNVRDPKSTVQAELGMKVACGFEMLLSDPQNQDKKAVREIQILLDDIKNDDAHLPDDADILSWSKREDDESWLDINYEDFERELAGKSAARESPMNKKGFGDKEAQDNLRKMVERFEDFLKDDNAGVEGAEVLDDMDNDDDDSDVSTVSDDSPDEVADQEGSFDEDEFTAMMREMMGMPANVMKEMMTKSKSAMDSAGKPRTASYRKKVIQELSSADEEEDDDEEGIRQTMDETEQELREAGALDLDPQQTIPQKVINGPASSDQDASSAADSGTTDEGVREQEISYNLAKNMLESFKSQGGAAGPGGNLMGLMGMQLPRDEPEKQ